MKYSKGDLIAIQTLEDKRVTAIVLAIFVGGQYYYCYIIEEDYHRLVYVKEIDFLITQGFDAEAIIDPDIFNLDYSFYEACSELFSYSPFFGFDDYDSESDESDD